jgi:hypothetical protein
VFIISFGEVAFCLTYVSLPESGYVNLYTPVFEKFSLLRVLGLTFSWIVLLVQYAIFIFVCLDILVTYVVSLPI